MIQITLVDMPQFSTPTWKVKFEGEEIGHIRQDAATQSKWVLMPRPGTRVEDKARKLTVMQWRSKEAAACALVAQYLEGRKEV
jgi:hypothetical protein